VNDTPKFRPSQQNLTVNKHAQNSATIAAPFNMGSSEVMKRYHHAKLPELPPAYISNIQIAVAADRPSSSTLSRRQRYPDIHSDTTKKLQREPPLFTPTGSISNEVDSGKAIHQFPYNDGTAQDHVECIQQYQELFYICCDTVMEQSSDTLVRMADNCGQQYSVPKDVAFQSATIKHIYNAAGKPRYSTHTHALCST
jgi:hypothetical protein